MKLTIILKSIVKWTFRLALLGLFLAFLLVFVAYWRSTNDCDRLTTAGGDRMKAIVYCDYGTPDVLKLKTSPSLFRATIKC